jgi:hypothetical protein
MTSLSRRALLLGGTVALAGCSDGDGGATPAETDPGTAPPTGASGCSPRATTTTAPRGRFGPSPSNRDEPTGRPSRRGPGASRRASTRSGISSPRSARSARPPRRTFPPPARTPPGRPTRRPAAFGNRSTAPRGGTSTALSGPRRNWRPTRSIWRSVRASSGRATRRTSSTTCDSLSPRGRPADSRAPALRRGRPSAVFALRRLSARDLRSNGESLLPGRVHRIMFPLPRWLEDPPFRLRRADLAESGSSTPMTADAGAPSGRSLRSSPLSPVDGTLGGERRARARHVLRQ